MSEREMQTNDTGQFPFHNMGSGIQTLASGEEGGFSLAEGNPSPPQQVKLCLADHLPLLGLEENILPKSSLLKFLAAS